VLIRRLAPSFPITSGGHSVEESPEDIIIMEQQQAAHPHRKPKAGPKAQKKKARQLSKQTNQPADNEAAKQRNPKVRHCPPWPPGSGRRRLMLYNMN